MSSIKTFTIATLHPLTKALLPDDFVTFSFSMTLGIAHNIRFPLYKFDPFKILVLVTVIYAN